MSKSTTVYAWVVVAASFLSHVIIYGISWTTGIFYDTFREEFGSDSTMTSLMTSLNTALLYGAGPLSGLLTDRFGHRPVAVAGSLITMLGLALSALATSSYFLLVSFGIVSGFGLGLSYIPFISIIGPLFDGSKYLALALGLTACGAGIGTLVFPPLLRFLINLYTWKGAILILSAISLNLCCAGFLLRPQKSERPVELTKPTSNSFRCKASPFFGSHLYATLCLNGVCLCFGMSIVYAHLASYARSTGCSLEASALLYSFVGGANFVGRIAFGLMANQSKVRSVWIYQAALCLCGAATCLCPLATDYAGLVAFSVVFGFLCASIGPLTPKIVIDCLGWEMLARAYGYLLIFQAIGQLVGAPVAGWLYDATEIYWTSFLLAGSALVLSSAVMFNWICSGCCSVGLRPSEGPEEADAEAKEETPRNGNCKRSQTTDTSLNVAT